MLTVRSRLYYRHVSPSLKIPLLLTFFRLLRSSLLRRCCENKCSNKSSSSDFVHDCKVSSVDGLRPLPPHSLDDSRVLPSIAPFLFSYINLLKRLTASTKPHVARLRLILILILVLILVAIAAAMRDAGAGTNPGSAEGVAAKAASGTNTTPRASARNTPAARMDPAATGWIMPRTSARTRRSVTLPARLLIARD